MSPSRTAVSAPPGPDLDVVRYLHRTAVACSLPGTSLEDCLATILETAVLLTEADKGNVQLFDPASGDLVLTAHQGFEEPFLRFFARVGNDASACASAMREVRRVVVEDVESSPIFVGTPALAVMLEAGVRAVQSTPLVSSGGNLLGMISTHYARPHAPPAAVLERMDLLARQSADYLERKLSEDRLRQSERELVDTFENAPLGLHWVGPDGRILRANRTELRTFGYTRDEYVGHHIAEFHVDRDVAADILRRLHAGEEIRGRESRIRCKDGSIRDVLIDSNVLWEDGKFVHSRCFTRDVTDRKRSTDEVARLAAIVESSTDAILSTDLRGTILSWNHGAERAYGYSATQAVGRPITILLPPDRLDEEPRILARIRRGERVDPYETVRRRSDGTCIDISLSASPILDAAGAVIGVSKIGRDISDRKRVEETLRVHERRLREVIDALPAAVYTTDAEGRLTHYNAACVELSGRTPQLGTDNWCVTWKLFHADGSPMPHDQCPMAIALKEGRILRHVEAIAERPDGTRIWFTPYPTLLHDSAGRVTGAINMLVDITERKHADLLLRTEKTALQLVAEGAKLRDVLQFLVTTVEAFSARSLVASFALLNEERTLFVESIGPNLPDSYHRAVEGMAVASDTGSCCRAVLTNGPVVVRDVAADPQWARFAAFMVPLGYRAAWSTLVKSPAGSALGTFALYARSPQEPAAHDREFVEGVTQIAAIVTERIRAMERIAQQAAALADESRRKDEFLAMLSHELRNPLAPIRSAAHVLRERERGEDLLARQARETIERQVANLTKIVGDLLDVARVVSDRFRLEPRVVDLRTICRNAVEAVATDVARRNHVLVQRMSDEPVWVNADETRMEQVLVNLLDNAAKYTHDGGRIEIACEIRRGSEARVSIRDNGVGIEAELLPRIFDLFTQADRSLARSSGGLGIGLAIVKRLVALHGGSIDVKSPPQKGGRGTQVTLTVPLAARPTSSPVPELPRIVGRGRRVLVVEDNDDQLEMLLTSLRLAGFSVQCAETGPKGLDVVRRWRPDVVLLDIGLPGLDGYEIARCVRSSPEEAVRSALLVALTGYGREADVARARQAGFDAHLAKPFSVEEVMRLILDRGARSETTAATGG